MPPDSEPARKFWQIALADLEKQLEAGRDGLSSAEAASRRLRYGPNTLEAQRRLSLPLKFLSRFRNPLVIILLVAAVISGVTGDLASFTIISAIVLMSAVLDTVQEYQAEQAAESLKVSVALKEQVLRDGQEVTVLGQDLVPGDAVLLAAGDLVPADGRLLEARDFFVNEALLTGESYPAEKHSRDEGVETPEVASATNAAFMGSSVMNGSARLLVCATGLTTQLGQIMRQLAAELGAPSGVDHAVADCVPHQLRDRADAELLKDDSAMGLDRLEADAEHRGDGLVAAPLGQELDDLALSIGQVIKGARRLAARPTGEEGFKHGLRHPPREIGLVVGEGLDRRDDMASRVGLQEVAAGARFQHVVRQLFPLVHGEDQHFRRGQCVLDAADCLQAVHFGHRQIEDHQLRTEFFGKLDRLPAVRRLRARRIRCSCPQSPRP
jgi:hypothetical protein